MIKFKLDNFSFTPGTGTISWTDSRFYSPVGDRRDTLGNSEDGPPYFLIPAETCTFPRELVDYSVIGIVTVWGGVTIHEIIEGEQMPTIKLGCEGDVIFTGTIPADEAEPIIIKTRSVS